MPGNPRMQIIEEMMQERVQSVSAERVAVYYKRLEDIPEDILRAACIGATENMQRGGVPTVAEIRARAGKLGRRTIGVLEPEGNVIPLHPECKRTVHETRYGPLLCCREEGHIGSCEAWFHAGGPQPEDAEAIWKLTGRRGNVVSLELDYEEPVI